MDRGAWAAKTVKRPRQQPAQPQYANYWAPLTHKRHTMPHPAQPQHTNYWAPRTRKRHQQEHRPQRPTESSDPTQHAKGRTGDCPGPRKGTSIRRNVTRGGGGGGLCVRPEPPPPPLRTPEPTPTVTNEKPPIWAPAAPGQIFWASVDLGTEPPPPPRPPYPPHFVVMVKGDRTPRTCVYSGNSKMSPKPEPN